MPRRPPPRVLQPPALPARPAARTPGPSAGFGAPGGAEPGRGGAAGGRGVAGNSALTPALSPVATERREGLDIHCGLQAPCPYGPAAACGLHGYAERRLLQAGKLVQVFAFHSPPARNRDDRRGFYNCGVLDISRRAIALLEFVVPRKQSEFVMRKQKAS